MKGGLKKSWLALCFLCLVIGKVEAKPAKDPRKARMIEDLTLIKHALEVGYAPAEWKESFLDWNLDREFERARKRVLESTSLTTKGFQSIVRDFLATTQDYHVSILFFSTEEASLPFGVKSANGRYFIDWMDANQLHPKFYAIQVGDELVEFDGHPIAEVIAQLKTSYNRKSNPQTEQAFAEIKLTKRQGLMGDSIPKGPVFITTRSASKGTLQTYQLMWNYQAERIANPLDFTQSLSFLWPKETSTKQLPAKEMVSPLHQAYAQEVERDGALGARKSFIPPLGPILWMPEQEEGKSEELSWYAYTYENAQGQSIGYIRIPHYMGGSEESKAFGELIDFFQEHTEALVIDQVHNFGGFVTFLYDLASTLSPTPLQTPRHRMKINQNEVLTAYHILDLIDRLLHTIEASKLNEEEEEEEPFDYQRLLFLKNFYEFTIEEWNAGRFLTNPIHIEGVDWINPHPHHQYTKPILMLIDELDFSGGDFMPAILQDNKRAVLFGSRTAGAGGFVCRAAFPNDSGIAAFSYTGSVAERVDAQKIENLGVVPDIAYALTEEDLQGGYQGYVSAVNQAVQRLLNEPMKTDDPEAAAVEISPHPTPRN